MAHIADRLATRVRRGVVWVVGLLAATAGPAWAQCEPTWLERGESGVPGVDWEVFCTTEWDPDGPGPMESVLVAGGSFTVAGNVLANNVAMWDGSEWKAFGGVFTTHEHASIGTQVLAVTVFEGDVIIGGNFDTIDGIDCKGVARWDGERWQPLAGSLVGWTSTAFPIVHALTVFDGELIAGGLFAVPGNPTAYGIARWNGSEWGSLGSLIGNGVQRVRALLEFNGQLVVAGSFSSSIDRVLVWDIAMWDGERWRNDYSPRSFVSFDGIQALGEYQGELVAGGAFTSLTQGVPARNIARWSGTRWEPLGAGVTSITREGVCAITVYKGELMVGGSLYEAPIFSGATMRVVQRWNGNEWEVVGNPGIALMSSQTPRVVDSFTVYKGDLFAAGNFHYADNGPTRSIAKWNGESWGGAGTGTHLGVECYTEYKGELYCGGLFRMIDGRLGPGVARWDGESWHPVGEGVDVAAYAMVEHEGDLIVGGTIGGEGWPAGVRVARWDGASWMPIGSGFNNRVDALAVYNGEIVALGLFTQIEGEPVNYIARWDGEAWRELGGGLTGFFSQFNRMDMAVFEGELYVGGSLSTAGGIAVRSISRWNGTEWRDVGGGTSGAVHALAEHEGMLYAGGLFTEAGGVATSRIASWDGETWHPIEVGPGHGVYALASHGSDLIAGGGFRTVGALPVNQIARWDGETWHAMGEGAGYYVDAFASFQGDLFVGGSFSIAGGMASSHWARWGCRPCYADCDESTGRGVLDIFDFLCFGNAFAANEPYACDCDLSTGPGVCDIFDFLCFGNAFSEGCE